MSENVTDEKQDNDTMSEKGEDVTDEKQGDNTNEEENSTEDVTDEKQGDNTNEEENSTEDVTDEKQDNDTDEKENSTEDVTDEKQDNDTAEKENTDNTIPSLSTEDIGDILDNVKLNEGDSEEILKKISDDKKNINTVDVGESSDLKKINDLYQEFHQFLSVKASIKIDTSKKQLISTGIELLDAVLGGGFAVGTFNTLAGTPGSGKSMLAMQILANAQKSYTGMIGAFLDSEEATSKERLMSLGVKYPPIDPVTDLTVEKVFKLIETLCLFKEAKKIINNPSIVVWDSIANTLSEKEREAADINSVIGYKARLLSILIPKYVAKVAKYKICWLSINQLRDQLSIGPYSAPKELRFMSAGKSLPGGTVLRYNAFILLEMKATAAIDPEKYGMSGQIVKCNAVKNKLFSPNIPIELCADFRTGFSNFWTNWVFLVKNKYIKVGAWNSLTNFPEKKFRTKEVEELYNTDTEFKMKYDELVKLAINTEIVDKYAVKTE